MKFFDITSRGALLQSKRPHLFYLMVSLVLWVALGVSSLLWNFRVLERHTLELATDRSRSFYQQIIVTRLWNARHGGIYVPVTDETPPNPYLDDPSRDVTTLTGMKLTKLNPAYMTRQISEIALEQNSILFHLTSLKPIRPANRADAWETRALQLFETGVEEQIELVQTSDLPVYRYMAPLVVKEECLACHAKQGYGLGDIRGGLSVTMPAWTILAAKGKQKVNLLLLHLGLLVLGVAGISFFQLRSQRQSAALEAANTELRKLTRAVEQSPASIVITDTRGAIEYVNPKFIKTTGYTSGEVLGENPRVLKSGEKLPEEYKELWETITSGKEWRGEFHNKRRNGELYWEFASISPIKNDQGVITNFLAVKEDITARKKVEERLNEMEQAMMRIHDSVYISDMENRIKFVNDAFCSNYGYSREDILGKKADILWGRKVEAEESLLVKNFRKTTETGWVNEFMDVRKDGTEFPSFLSGSILKDEKGRDFRIIRVIRDITDRKRLEEALERLSYLDGLTGIPNRRSFDLAFQLEWKRAVRNQSPISLIMADIDYFKGFNDLYGHQAGDACLKKVAGVIKGSMQRPADLAARYGGEEFVLLLSETDLEGARLLAESLRKKVAALNVPHERSQAAKYVTISLGVSSILPHHHLESEPEQLLSAADQALYQAKAQGRNRVQVHEM